MKNIKISPYIFRGYDIRGIYGDDLTEEVAYKIGNIYAKILREEYAQTRVIVGMDNRLSSKALKTSLLEGITEAGVNCIDIGLVTSPMLYYANEICKLHAGIMVTASHNPKEYNGFKIAFDEKGEICGEEIEEFRDKVINSRIYTSLIKGKVINLDFKEEYIKMFLEKISLTKKLKVVIDCGNGTASIIAKDIFDKFPNLECKYICCDSDPNFPIHHPDPAEEENLELLRETVLRYKADIGIAFDGDCDRVGFVDNKGRILPADYMLAIFAKNIIPNVDNKKVFFDVSCSKTLTDEIEKAGGEAVCYKTGNSYIKRKMLTCGGLFGGEISGHTFFNDKFYGFDDGIYAAFRMLEILDNTCDKLSNIMDGLIKYNSSPVIKIIVAENIKKQIVDDFKKYCIENKYNVNVIDGARIELENGFALVRMSNTTPKITVRFEGKTKEDLENIQNTFMRVLNDILSRY